MFSGGTIAEFTSQTSKTLGSRLRTYFTGGGKWQRNVSGGLQTTNAIFDIETPVELLGTFLAAARANDSQVFQQIVDAYKLRARVAHTMLPHAQLSFYGSPNRVDLCGGRSGADRRAGLAGPHRREVGSTVGDVTAREVA